MKIDIILKFLKFLSISIMFPFLGRHTVLWEYQVWWYYYLPAGQRIFKLPSFFGWAYCCIRCVCNYKKITSTVFYKCVQVPRTACLMPTVQCMTAINPSFYMNPILFSVKGKVSFTTFQSARISPNAPNRKNNFA